MQKAVKRGPDWSWLGFLKVVPLCLALATGSLTVPRDAMLLTGSAAPGQATALYAWLRICFVISAGIVWFQQHKRILDLDRQLLPRIHIQNLRRRVWPLEQHGFTGAEFYFDLFNSSQAQSLEGVRVEVIQMVPDAIGYLPVPLHIKHDNYESRECSINPGATRQIDLITGPVNSPGSQAVMIVAHTVNKDRTAIPPAKYRLTVRASAKNTPAATALFEAWIDRAGELRCVAL